MPRKPRRPNSGDALRARSSASFKRGQKRGNMNQFAGKMPVITEQPTDWTGDEGGSAVFTLTAISEDGSPLTYQWQERVISTITNLVDNAEFSGTTTDTLTVNGIDYLDENREFRCRVCNDHTCVYSVWVYIHVTGVTFFIITEAGSQMIDEPATNDIVDERSP